MTVFHRMVCGCPSDGRALDVWGGVGVALGPTPAKQRRGLHGAESLILDLRQASFHISSAFTRVTNIMNR